MPIEVTTTERGFRVYGEPVTDHNGGAFEVVESSLATEPCVRVYVDASKWDTRERPARASLHLNAEQAQALIDRLQCWLEEADRAAPDL